MRAHDHFIHLKTEASWLVPKVCKDIISKLGVKNSYFIDETKLK